jgi:hypothetical protein
VASVASTTSASLALLTSLATSALLSASPAYQLFGFVNFAIVQKQNHTAMSSSMHMGLPQCDQGLQKLAMWQFIFIAHMTLICSGGRVGCGMCFFLDSIQASTMTHYKMHYNYFISAFR